MSGRVAMPPSPLTLRIRADRAHRRADDGLGWAEDAPDPALAGRNAPQAPRRASRRGGRGARAGQGPGGAPGGPGGPEAAAHHRSGADGRGPRRGLLGVSRRALRDVRPLRGAADQAAEATDASGPPLGAERRGAGADGMTRGARHGQTPRAPRTRTDWTERPSRPDRAGP